MLGAGSSANLPARTGKVIADRAEMSPVLQSFADDYHKFPFVLSWESGGPGHDLVFAAGSSAERAGWVAAVMGAVKALQVRWRLRRVCGEYDVYDVCACVTYVTGVDRAADHPGQGLAHEAGRAADGPQVGLAQALVRAPD